MTAKFFDQHNESNADNNTFLGSGSATRALLLRNATSQAFFAELTSDDGAKLLIGLGSNLCCAQFTNSDDEPPYFVATTEFGNSRSGFEEFIIGNEPTEVPHRWCFPLPVLLDVAAHFVETGRRSDKVSWEEI